MPASSLNWDKDHRQKSSQNKLCEQHNHTMSFFTHSDFESVLSSNTHIGD